MKFEEIKNVLEQIKNLAPTITIPDTRGLSRNEEMEKLSAYIMAFGDLPYENTLKALKGIIKNEKIFNQFIKMPIPTLARETVKITEFTEEEKQRYHDSLECEYSVDPFNKTMLGWHKRGGGRWKEQDRQMTKVEIKFWVDGTMSKDDYKAYQQKEKEAQPF